MVRMDKPWDEDVHFGMVSQPRDCVAIRPAGAPVDGRSFPRPGASVSVVHGLENEARAINGIEVGWLATRRTWRGDHHDGAGTAHKPSGWVSITKKKGFRKRINPKKLWTMMGGRFLASDTMECVHGCSCGCVSVMSVFFAPHITTDPSASRLRELWVDVRRGAKVKRSGCLTQDQWGQLWGLLRARAAGASGAHMAVPIWCSSGWVGSPGQRRGDATTKNGGGCSIFPPSGDNRPPG